VVTKGSRVQTLERLNGNYVVFIFANGEFKWKWERLTEAMGISKAKGGLHFIHDEKWKLLKDKWT